VATPQQAHAVLLGAQGLRAGLAPGHAPIVALMSTVPVETVHELRAGLGADVGGFVDAPISGGLSRAERGTLTVMIGGEAAVVETVRPVLQAFATAIIRCGALGAGQAMKIVNNVVGNANVIFTAEAYRLASELGLEIADTARALEAATGRNFYSADPEGLPATFAALVRDRASFDALLAIVRKDVGFAHRLAASAQGHYPAIEGLKTIMDSLGDETYDNWRYIGALPARRT
jgi:3-hydroxyisobutyrate dehydrogenase-like beta-hydroxyacid dehydrogenase